MLINAKSLTGFTLNCLDGEIGTVKEFFFYDKLWTICYLVADTGSWFAGRQMLISPHLLGTVMEDTRQITIAMTKKQIEGRLFLDSELLQKYSRSLKAQDLFLRNTREVGGHHIQAADGKIGHVEDFVIDDELWEIRYFVVDTRNWWPGKKVLVSSQWIERVSSNKMKVFVNLSCESIRQSREYSVESLTARDYETELPGYYNRVRLGSTRLLAK
jgi:hypothetical protein